MKLTGKERMALVLMALGLLVIVSLLLTTPLVCYIGMTYGWSDPRIEWAPLGIPGVLIGLALFRLGASFADNSRKALARGGQ